MTDTDLFQPGTTLVRRDVHAGRVWTAMPQRVVDDTGHVLTVAYWPGIESLAPTTWITSTRNQDDVTRKQGLEDLAAGTWTLGRYRLSVASSDSPPAATWWGVIWPPLRHLP